MAQAARDFTLEGQFSTITVVFSDRYDISRVVQSATFLVPLGSLTIIFFSTGPPGWLVTSAGAVLETVVGNYLIIARARCAVRNDPGKR